ncbi:disulfide bond formation protein B [Commensalibacter nepenthis]|uniref:Disulfide bond formation protein B n=1 Tax=Commensalibacter nepenthis TaxID=3043872 RepID=A0ABT6Q6P7_9PROT|nr:disulfide bond formation protein B [Commensalibacter sp. TBRC 10068]MDI2112573.1 disulfide bond formation protein B [Commensalibacter sp. TBRC 10068]
MSHQQQQYIKNLVGISMVCAGLFALGFAWLAQNTWNMVPCGLCLLERWPYRILIVAGIFLLLARGKLIPWVKAIIVLILVASLGLSFVHVGVEEGWWASPLPECYAIARNTQDLATRFMEMPDRPHKPCDLPSYLFDWLPISLTMMNGLYSFALLMWVFISNQIEKKYSGKFR